MTVRQFASAAFYLAVLVVLVIALWEMSVAGGSQAAPSKAPAQATFSVPSGVSVGGNVPAPVPATGLSMGGNVG